MSIRRKASRLSNKPSAKYRYYEAAVQSPDVSAAFLDYAYHDLNRRRPLLMREDFCGTFLNSIAWIKRHRDTFALGLDLDPEPLAYGRQNHLRKLARHEQKRMRLLKMDVRETTRPAADVCLAANFSFFIFKTEQELVRYFKAVRRSLAAGGLLAVEIAGGPSFVRAMRESKTLKRGNRPWFKYTWHQKKFNPIDHHGSYAIHFDFPSGRRMKDAFTYDWRVWTIPEVRHAMKQAGFPETYVYWEEQDDDGEDTGVYTRHERANNDYSWICYVVGHRPLKKTKPSKGKE
ncbi:MAG: class I SAM-dependent methyltransferase [Bacteriovoracia bacterium]